MHPATQPRNKQANRFPSSLFFPSSSRYAASISILPPPPSDLACFPPSHNQQTHMYSNSNSTTVCVCVVRARLEKQICVSQRKSSTAFPSSSSHPPVGESPFPPPSQGTLSSPISRNRSLALLSSSPSFIRFFFFFVSFVRSFEARAKKRAKSSSTVLVE